MSHQKTIAVMTGGGDCPGLNAVIRAIVRTASLHHIKVLGIERGFGGLLGNGRVYELTLEHVKDILNRGGTILGTTNRGNPFRYESDNGIVDRGNEVIAQLKALHIDCLLSIGGDGSQRIALDVEKRGIPVIGIPKTIDNDLDGTETTFGFHTAVEIATEALDRLHSTAESHDRVMILEVMGRHAGFIALHTALAGSADICLIPEIPFDIDVICHRISTRIRRGTYFSLVVVAEGAYPLHGQVSVVERAHGASLARLGGMGEKVAQSIHEKIQRDVRVTVLGHIQRGGTPSAYDRILATRFGVFAVETFLKGQSNVLVGIRSGEMITTPLAQALAIPKRVNIHHDIVTAARAVGICFGES